LRNIGEHSLLLWAERMLRFERFAVTSNDVRNIEAPGLFRARHALSLSISRQQIERTRRIADNLIGDACISNGG
jgi:hypothetical protein